MSYRRLLTLLVCIGSFGALLFALVAEKYYGVQPCALCLYERYGFLILGCVTGISLLKASPYLRIATIFTALCVFGLGVFHLGVEHKIWRAPLSCTNTVGQNLNANLSTQDKLAQLKAHFAKTQKIVPCDQVNWRIFGLSATLWMVIMSFGFVVFVML